MVSATTNLSRALWQVYPARLRARSGEHTGFAVRGTLGNLAALVLSHAELRGDRTAIAQLGERGRSLSHGQLRAEVSLLADRLRGSGVTPGDRIAILAEAGPAWCVGFLATLYVGAVAVPLDSNLPLAELGKQLIHSGAETVLVSAAQELIAASLTGRFVPGCRRLRLDETVPTVTVCPDDSASTQRPCCRNLLDPALICYTSGTTGCPKGVVVSHGNLISQLVAIRIVMGNGPRTRVVSFLPPSHLFELTAGLLAVLAGGGSVLRAVAPTGPAVLDAMAQARPTSMVVVPLFLSAVKAAIDRETGSGSLLRRLAFSGLGRISRSIRARRLRRILMWPVLRRFGGQLDYFVCGGAPLDPELITFFEDMGIQVFQGYGMTEASPVVAANGPESNRIGSVGRPIPGTEIQISPEGEILVRGPQVMLRYHRNPRATVAAVDTDGWLHTGDLGRLDEDGFLYVEGRRSHRIVLACGEKVQPEEVETAILRSNRIAECGVVGRRSELPLHRGSEEVWAVVVPGDSLRASDKESLQHAVRMEVSRCCADLASFKRPTRVIVRTSPLPVTSSRKLRRAELHAWLDRCAT
jgi:long-chain acyl-CoA synthetase